MDLKRQDIYESEGKGAGDGDGGGGRPAGNNPWLEMFRHSKRSATIFRIVILAFIVFMSLLVVEQMQRDRIDHSGYTPDKSVGSVKLRTDSVLDFEGDLESALIIDELIDIEAVQVEPSSGDIEMNIHWVKQAAMRIFKAERAYETEEWADAVEHYNQALKILPDLKGVDARIGLCFMRMEDYNASAHAFSNASADSTNTFRILNNLGVARLAENEFGAAEKNFKRVLEIEANYAPALYNMALLYYRTQMYSESTEFFERYFALNEVDVEAMQIYTDALIKLERWDDAAKMLEKSAKNMPQAAPIHMSLAYVLSQTGELDQAMDYLTRGVKLIDRPRAMTMVAAPEYDALRQRQDFKELVDRLAQE